jgi:hypothetical protein
MGLTIMFKHVIVGIIGLMDETTVKVNIPPINYSKNPEF